MVLLPRHLDVVTKYKITHKLAHLIIYNNIDPSFGWIFSFYSPFLFLLLSCTSVAIIFPVVCVQERLLALKRSMSFMQEMDFTQQAAILGDEDLTADLPPPEIIPIPVESAKKSRKQPVKDMKEVIRYSLFVHVISLMMLHIQKNS